MEFSIYLVEDTPKLNKILSTQMRLEGWKVRSFLDGEEARSAVKDRPHLWVLDIILPNVNGYDLLKEIKEDNPNTPIIFISALNSGSEKILGLELGSDDYVPKPFLPRELVLRTHRLLERLYPSESLEDDTKAPPRYILPPYIIYPEVKQVSRDSEEIPLTAQEMCLLLLFYRHSGDIMSRERILHEVWGEGYYASDRIVDVLVSSLRKKMPELKLVTYYGHGYRLMAI